MAQNPIEQSFLTRTIFGLAVITVISIGGGTVASLFMSLDVPYGPYLGVVVGGLLTLTVFIVLYNRYDAQF